MTETENKPTQTTVRVMAPELPANIDDWERFLKQQRTINDYVEDTMRECVNSPQGTELRAYLRAAYNEHAVEGSCRADDYEAAHLLREYAREHEPEGEVAKAKLETVKKALCGPVARRYHVSRQQRRNTLQGQVVPGGNDDDNSSDEENSDEEN